MAVYTSAKKRRKLTQAIVYDSEQFCNLCNHYYRFALSFKLHIIHVHHVNVTLPPITTIQKFICIQCGKYYSTTESIKQHHRYTRCNKARKMDIPSPDIDYTYLCCHFCQKIFKNHQSIQCHLYRVHQKTPSTRASKIASCFENYHCNLCNRQYYGRGSYMHHLRYVHDARLRKLKLDRPVMPKTDLLPDINNPDFHCHSCDRVYKNQTSYMSHLRRIHKMRLKPYRIKVKNEPTPYFCKECHFHYKNKASFRYHINAKHRNRPVTITRGMNPQPNATPEMDNPHAYCQACDRTFKSRLSFRQHVNATHQISLDSIRLPLAGNQNNTRFFCQTCSKSCKNRSHYRYHLFCKHNIPYYKSKNL